MDKRPKACFCWPGVMIFREALSLSAARYSYGYYVYYTGIEPFCSQLFPESWDHQWYIEVNRSSLIVRQTVYGKSPSATFVFQFGSQAPIALHWPAKQASEMCLNYATSPCDYANVSVSLTVPVGRQYARLAKNPSLEFHGQLKAMFENQLGSDVTIITSNGEIRAHWAMLAARSPFFSAMTKSDYKEKQENKIVVEISYETCEKMMQFIYSNQTEIVQEEEGRELLKAGDMYLVDGLKVAAENFLCSRVTPSNAVELLILSHLHNAKQLKVTSMEVILENSKSVVEHQRFPDLCKYPDLMAQLVSLSGSNKA